jgi:hypothetical protein
VTLALSSVSFLSGIAFSAAYFSWRAPKRELQIEPTAGSQARLSWEFSEVVKELVSRGVLVPACEYRSHSGVYKFDVTHIGKTSSSSWVVRANGSLEPYIDIFLPEGTRTYARYLKECPKGPRLLPHFKEMLAEAQAREELEEALSLLDAEMGTAKKPQIAEASPIAESYAEASKNEPQIAEASPGELAATRRALIQKQLRDVL